jgi:hypothetical protein
MTQAFIILVRVEEDRLDDWQDRRIEAAIKELHEAANKPPSSCHIYQVKNPKALNEWERQLKRENVL